MPTAVIFEERIEIPYFASLEDFRQWTYSEDFPERGRIDFIAGKIEVEVSPEDIFRHEVVKGEIHARLYLRVERDDLGHVFVGRTRICVPEADLSVEPDVVFVSHEALDSGRVKLVPSATGEPDSYIELEGPPELIVEVVSQYSVAKDTRRLPGRYAAAGVREYWLVDVRKEPLVFTIHHLQGGEYRAAEPDAQGFQTSDVFGCGFRLDRSRDSRGHLKFDLVERT